MNRPRRRMISAYLRDGLVAVRLKRDINRKLFLFLPGDAARHYARAGGPPRPLPAYMRCASVPHNLSTHSASPPPPPALLN